MYQGKEQCELEVRIGIAGSGVSLSSLYSPASPVRSSFSSFLSLFSRLNPVLALCVRHRVLLPQDDALHSSFTSPVPPAHSLSILPHPFPWALHPLPLRRTRTIANLSYSARARTLVLEGPRPRTAPPHPAEAQVPRQPHPHAPAPLSPKRRRAPRAPRIPDFRATRRRPCYQRWRHAGTGIPAPLGVVFVLQASKRRSEGRQVEGGRDAWWSGWPSTLRPSSPMSQLPASPRPRTCYQRWHHAGAGVLVPLGVVFMQACLASTG
ncbi:hypothetical protein B0H13DRAFT_2383406 [Mycena leptocephala]|nr:hypothetical protein B0H13DRAFT_2383406 [Mycena leptocephala]